ncbi:MAG: hypothetical protein QOF30_3655, partial [Acidimicrobiaceae bacterium]|nr:hypothetical protein [Acidimicrobiaceae bacterium]
MRMTTAAVGLRPAVCGLRLAACGLRLAACGLRLAACRRVHHGGVPSIGLVCHVIRDYDEAIGFYVHSLGF